MASLCNAADVSSSIAISLPTKVSLVAIDPGFGGNRLGPPGCDDKIHAKDINLQIAKKVAEQIKKVIGINVLLIRDDDVDVTLEERCAFANTSKADIFISISVNGSEDSSASGIETYFLNLATDSDAINTVARKNAKSEKNIAEMHAILNDLMQNAKVTVSDLLANSMQGHLYAKLKEKNRNISNRGTKKAPFYVLLGAEMPAIVVNPGFITNPEECKLLSSQEYQEEISFGIVEGIQAFMKERTTQPVASPDPRASQPSVR
jgi:N-acetylmuramoyl-L-alanine amidase